MMWSLVTSLILVTLGAATASNAIHDDPVFAAVAAAIKLDLGALQEAWRSHVSLINKRYHSTEEEQKRKAIFAENLRLVQQLNEGNSLATFDVVGSDFADMDATERERFLTYREAPELPMESQHERSAQVLALPMSVDYRDMLNPVKSQGACGSCWSFAATGIVESTVALALGVKPPTLSEMFLVSCIGPPSYTPPVKPETEPTEKFGCAGGNVASALDFIVANKGQPSAAAWPYVDMKNNSKLPGTCTKSKTPVAGTEIIQGSKQANWASDIPAMKARLVEYGPFAARVDANQMHFYTGGIMNTEYICGSKFSYNHGVMVVGYGKEDGVEYWIMRNSWNNKWGESGYGRIKLGSNFCGIEGYLTYTTYSKVRVAFGNIGNAKVIPIDVQIGSKYSSLPAGPSPSGCTFSKWVDANGKTITKDTVVDQKKAHTLTATYTGSPIPVTFNANGGNTPNFAKKDYAPCSQYGTLPTTTRSGYRLLGWYTAQSGGSLVTPTSDVSPTVTQLFAQWKKQVKISFDAKGGKAVAPIFRDEGTLYEELPTTTMSKNWLDGWWITPAGQDSFQVSPTTKVGTTDVTLWAKWTPVFSMGSQATLKTCNSWIVYPSASEPPANNAYPTYPANADVRLTVYPDQSNMKIRFTWEAFGNRPAHNTNGKKCGEKCCDTVNIINGSDPTKNGAWACGSSVSDKLRVKTSTDKDGIASLRFLSDNDATTVGTGFTFRVSCVKSSSPVFDEDISGSVISSPAKFVFLFVGVLALAAVIVGAVFGVSLLSKKLKKKKNDAVVETLAEELVERCMPDEETQ